MAATLERTNTVGGGEDAVGSPEKITLHDMRRARALRRALGRAGLHQADSNRSQTRGLSQEKQQVGDGA